MSGSVTASRRECALPGISGFVVLTLCYVQFLMHESSWAQQTAGPGHEALGTRGMVVSASPEASRIGRDVLRRGGNAVDAAVAVGFALAVTYPSAGNLAGGSYIVIRMADGRSTAIDARETAPLAATRDMYRRNDGSLDTNASLFGARAAGVPGTVHGLLLALERYGTQPRTRMITPALMLARDGFRLPPNLAALFAAQRSYFESFPSSMSVFTGNGRELRTGERWKQPDLAETLQRIHDAGTDGFYRGRTAELIHEAMRRDGGLITREDLAGYRAIERPVLQGTYRGHDILTMPPSSGGGVALLQILGMLERYPLGEWGRDDPRTPHVMFEAMRRVYADRATWLGDPAFARVPMAGLLERNYLDERARDISLTHASRSDTIAAGVPEPREGTHTTHYSIIDRWGNAVAVTTTLNSVCGSKYVIPGTGMLANNEMDDFSTAPGMPNQFGLTGGDANAIAPGKRMLSSMTPTIVLRDGYPRYIIGSPGGSMIITTVLQVLLNLIDHGMTPARAVQAKRVHHQWRPDSVLVEPDALSGGMRDDLTRMGHRIREVRAMGRVELISIDRRRRLYIGCSDPRGHGLAAGW